MSKIFHEFEVFDESENSSNKFVIQEVPRDRFNDFADFMVQYFITGTPLNECKKIADYPEIVELRRKSYLEKLKENYSVICFKEGSRDIVAVNLLTIKNKNDSEQEITDHYPQPYQDVLDILELAEKKFNVFEHYQVDKILYSVGMTVHPDYRGKGIATELFKTRDPILRYLGLEVTSAECTSLGSQIASERAGYECHLVFE